MLYKQYHRLLVYHQNVMHCSSPILLKVKICIFLSQQDIKNSLTLGMIFLMFIIKSQIYYKRAHVL